MRDNVIIPFQIFSLGLCLNDGFVSLINLNHKHFYPYRMFVRDINLYTRINNIRLYQSMFLSFVKKYVYINFMYIYLIIDTTCQSSQLAPIYHFLLMLSFILRPDQYNFKIYFIYNIYLNSTATHSNS